MILYLDSSALVKLYVEEARSLDTVDVVGQAAVVATSAVSRVEVSSAFARGVRAGLIAAAAGRRAQEAFSREAAALVILPITERIVLRAQELVWDSGLRGYDAVQLASALAWQERMGAAITMATFDVTLGSAAVEAGLDVWPPAANT